MAIVNGVVEGSNEKYGKYSILVNGNWYGTKLEWAPSTRPNKGDTVQFDDGGAKYLKGLKVIGSGGAPTTAGAPAPKPYAKSGGFSERQFPVPPLAPERTINRQNALTAAVNYHTGCDVAPEQVIAVARMFEAYTTGDLDLEEAQKAIESAV